MPARSRNLTSGGLGGHILRLSLPAAAEMALFAFSGMLNAVWLGRLGGSSLAAVSMGTTLRLVLISPMMGLSVGGMAMVARCVGADDQRQADHALLQTLLLVAAFVAPLALVGLAFGHVFLGWMGARDQLLVDAAAYLRIIMPGLFFMETLPTMNGVIRGAGHPEQTLRINIVSTGIMTLLEPALVLGWGPIPALGVRGDAWAAVLGSAAGVLAQLYVLLRRSAGVGLHLRDLKPDIAMMARIVRVALPTTAQRFSPNLANALLTGLVASFGNEVLTGYSVLTRVAGFLQAPANGIANASSAIVGQNLGAGKPERSRQAGLLGGWIALAASTLIFGALALRPGPVLGLFHRSSTVLAEGARASTWLMPGLAASSWSLVVSNALCGAGDTLSAMWISMGSLWLVQLPLCWALSLGLGWGPIGVWVGLAIGYATSALGMNARFSQGRWMTLRI